MAAKKPKKEKEESVYLKNVWQMGDTCPQYADNLILRFQDGVFHLMFFQQQVPPLVGSPKEMAEQLREQGVMDNRCVARLVVSSEKISAMIEAMQKTYEINVASKKDEQKRGHSNGVK